MYAAVKQSLRGPQSSLQPGSVESSPSVPPNSQQLAEVTGQLERLHGMLLRNFLFGMNGLCVIQFMLEVDWLLQYRRSK